MTPKEWLLLLLAYRGAPDGLDPVRIQKAMFLLKEDMGPGLPADEAYDFAAYNYGPMSKRIYTDLDELAAEGLVRSIPVSGQSWARFQASPHGLAEAERVAAEAADGNLAAAQKLYEVKQLVAHKTFDELLDYVYDRHPEFEERSIFRRRSQA